MNRAARLADQLWGEIPDLANEAGTITLPATLVLSIYQFLRQGDTDELG